MLDKDKVINLLLAQKRKFLSYKEITENDSSTKYASIDLLNDLLLEVDTDNLNSKPVKSNEYCPHCGMSRE